MGAANAVRGFDEVIDGWLNGSKIDAVNNPIRPAKIENFLCQNPDLDIP